MQAFAFRVGVVLLLLAGAAPASAQAVFSGVVLDPTGAPVEGATIYLTHVGTRTQLEFPTTVDGRFEFSGLPEGEYRVTSMGAPIRPFTVSLGDSPVHREIKLTFGPFFAEWMIIPTTTAREAAASRGAPAGQPPGFRCAERGAPLCGPESLIQEFERDEAERLKGPVLGPRMVGMPQVSYPQALIDRRIEGVVAMESRIGVDGELIDLRVVRADHPDLGEAALSSARSVAWEPARIRGMAREVPITMVVEFRLEPFSRPRPGTIPQSVVRTPVRRVQQEASPAAPAFDVASVKPNTSGAPMVRMQTLPGGRFNAINVPLRQLIQFAYGIRASQLEGPGWIDDARYDITATGGAMPEGPIAMMLRTLLADRFKLVVREETREASIFALVVARDDRRLGPQLRPASGECTPPVQGQPPAPGANYCGMGFMNRRLSGRSVTIDDLARNLAGQLNRPVVNRTNLDGMFDVDLEFAAVPGGGGLGPLPPQPGQAPPPPDERPVLATAVQEQLGLRLENARGPVEFTVIERVAQPTPD